MCNGGIMLCHSDISKAKLGFSSHLHVQCLGSFDNPSAVAACVLFMTLLRIARCFPMMYFHSKIDVEKQRS